MNTENTIQKESEPTSVERTRSGQFYRPNVDIVEKADELVLVADMPGVKGSEVDIHFEDGELTIHGPVSGRYDDQTLFLLNEFGIGDFYRTFRVSEQVDPSRIHAEFSKGVLTLHLPKVEAAKPRKINVQAG
jgi:HSP20 family molecular chaperone IbpA